MAIDEKSTYINVPPNSAAGKKDIAIAQANGGTTVFETSGDIYVTEVVENLFNQRVINEYSNTVQTNNAVTNYPGGTTNGEVQYYKDGAFGGTPSLMFNELTSALTVSGNINTGNIEVVSTMNTFDLNVTHDAYIGNIIAQTTANLGDVANVAILGGTAPTPDSSDSFLRTDGAGQLTWETVNNVANANYSAYTGLVSNAFPAQPNITSVANALVIGNIEMLGNVAAPVVKAANDKALYMGVYNTTGSGNAYQLAILTTGNVSLPVAADGNTILNSADDVMLQAASANYFFSQTGDSNLANTVTANYFSGTLNLAANDQPNITNVGTLLALTVTSGTYNNAATSTGNITADNINAGNLLTANYVGNSTIRTELFANVGNVANLFVTGNANVTGNINASNITATGNVAIVGNLSVDGTTTYINITNLDVQDPLISLGGGANGAPLILNDGKDRGIEMIYYANTPATGQYTAYMGLVGIAGDNVNNLEYVFATSATVASEVVTVSTYGNIRANYVFANISGSVSGNLVNGNSSVNVAANGNVTLNAVGVTTVTVTGTGANVTGTANITGNLSAANAALGNLVTANNFTGNIIAGTSNIVITTGANITMGVAGNAARFTVTGQGANITGYANVTGNVIAANFVGILANGSSNITITQDANVSISSNGNTNVLVITDTGANIAGTANITGNLVAGNITGVANVVADEFNGNLSNGLSRVSIPVASSNIELTVNSTAVVIATTAGANVTGNLDVSDTTTAANVVVTDTLTLNGGALTTANTTFNLLNANVTTLNFAGAATALTIGAATGTSTVQNDLVLDGNVQVKGGAITTNQTTFNVANATATTLNIGGAATTINVGSASGTTTIGNALSVTTDLEVKGGDITTTATTFTVANSVATTLRMGGAATTVSIGASSGSTTTIGNALSVGANANVTGNLNVTANANVTGNVFVTNNANITANVNVTGNINITANANITANLNVSGESNLNAVGNVIITGGNDGEYLQTDGAGNLTWAVVNWSNIANIDNGDGPTDIAVGKNASADASGIALGESATAGIGSISIGKNTGGGLPQGSVGIAPDGSTLGGTALTAGLYMKPLRGLNGATDFTTANGWVGLYYNPTTGEIGYSGTAPV